MVNVDKSNLKYVLELKNIRKVFPGVVALDKVSLSLKPGEVLALVGENGAGKSTLINCMTGVLTPDQGEILVDGVPVQLKNPQMATEMGISVVHQERNLIPTFDVAENIFFDKICGKGLKPVNSKWMHENAKELLNRVRLSLDPTDSVEDLSSAQKQLIEIARALSVNSHILLLDEPTASISIKEADMLLDIVKKLRQEGVAIIYVSHKLEEIFSIADRVAVIRDGNNVGDAVPIGELNRDRLIEMMVGSREMLQRFNSQDRSDAPYVLQAIEVESKESPKAASFELRKGQILGWYGLVGAGRTELARKIIGIDPIKKGELIINGKRVRIRSYKEAFEKHSIYYLSENRKEEGLFLMHSIATNISIVALDKIKNKAKLNSVKRERRLAKEYAKRIQIKMSSPDAVVSSLSGGNQQKVCIAKCLITEPEIIIFDEPTVGIDVKTKSEIHRLIYDLSMQGKSIILISSDLPELIQMAEKVLVFRDGEIVGELENSKDYEVMSTAVMENILGI
ncbi:MAG: sugar ABC transporter ATP-binding protein [Christensenellales bacterium]|jgi:ribose transport system ATP-binding protein